MSASLALCFDQPLTQTHDNQVTEMDINSKLILIDVIIINWLDRAIGIYKLLIAIINYAEVMV